MKEPTKISNLHQHSMDNLLKHAVEKIDSLYLRGKAISGIPTGFTEFDELTNGIQSGELTVVAGLPSTGISTFATNIVENAATNNKISVAFFSMEMPAESLILRMLSSLGEIKQSRMKTGQLYEDDWPRLTSATCLLNEAKIFIDDTPSLSTSEIRNRVQELNHAHDIGLIVVDNLQLIKLGNLSNNQESEVSEISKQLKVLAKELKVPVVVLSQVDGMVERNYNRRPLLSNLYQSGNLEKIAEEQQF